MRRMLDLTDINSVAGKKLYLHEIEFDYSTGTENVTVSYTHLTLPTKA